MQPVKFVLLDLDYILEGDKPVVRLWGKTNLGESIVVFDKGFRPYFYVEPRGLGEELAELKKRLENHDVEGRRPEKVEEVERKFLGRPKKLLKITLTIPSDIPRFRETIKGWSGIRETYEYAVSFARRYLIDKKFTPLSWLEVIGLKVNTNIDVGIAYEADELGATEDEKTDLTILAFDIETVIEDGEEKIIMVSYVTNKGQKGVITYGSEDIESVNVVTDEKELIKEFVEAVKTTDPDIITGYNTDRYDFQKMEERANKYLMPLRLGRDESSLTFSRRGRIPAVQMNGRTHIDIFDFVEHIIGSSLSTDILTLDNVAREITGAGKEKLSWMEIENLWKIKNVTRISEYCLQDSELALKLAQSLLPQIFELSKIVGQVPFDVSRMTYSQLVEWLLMKKAFEDNELIPNRPKYDEVMRRRKASPYVGGYIHPPIQGMHDNIALFDFQSLYPTITATHNISPETLNCSCCPENKVPGEEYNFCSKKKGFIPKIIEELVSKRIWIQEKMENIGERTREHKILDSRQYALKILANAIYGYYAYAGSRWYSRVCAQSITSWGRYYIKTVIELAQNQGFNVIYGDTDSLFLAVESKKDIDNFLGKANKTLPGIMELEFRNLYKSGIFVLSKTGLAAKKRYALIDNEDNIIVRGLERVRRDWAGIAKEAQEKVLEAILIDKDPDKAIRTIRRIISDLKKGKIELGDLVIYTQITRPLKEYEQIGPHVVAARKALQRGRIIKEGLTVSYIITKGLGSISSRAEPAEFATNYDPDYYINNQVLPATLRILSGLGYTKQDLLEEVKTEQYSLDKYVKKKRFGII